MPRSKLIIKLIQVWRHLTQPHHSVRNRTQQLELQLFLGLELIVLICVLIGVAFYPYVPLIVLALLLVVAYLISRTRYFHLGSIIFVLALSITPFINMLITPETVQNPSAEWMWLVIPLLASGLLLSARSTLVLTIGYMLLILGLGQVYSHLDASELGRLIGLVISVSAAVLTYKSLNKQAENELELYRQHLEQLVDARTYALRTANKQIAAALDEKVILLQEIHHRVKNNMQIVSSLLNLQSNQIESETTRALFIESQNRIQSMALVHEHLYQSSDLSQVGFDNYILELVGRLGQSYQATNVNLEIDVKHIRVGIDRAIPYGLIINELVSNAYKHAFPDGAAGTITVHMYEIPETQTYELSVKDNGIGLPDGEYTQNGQSLGLQLVHSLVAQVGGSLQIINQDGTTFRLSLPIEQAYSS